MKIKNIYAVLAFAALVTACNSETTEIQEIDGTATDSLLVVEEPQISELELTLQKQGLVNIQEIDSSIMVELKYSTTDNFFGEDVYGSLAAAYFQPDVAKKLKKAQLALKEINPAYSLLIYDGVRPHSVQKILWDKLDSIPPKTREAYVANPAKGSIHNYGCAADLTVFNIAADSTLDMGTKYDFFGYLAYPRKERENLRNGLLSQQQIDNRLVLRNVMVKSGFMPITSEWWHFNSTSRSNAEKLYRIVQ
ncbi:MAG: M15 family metallopeptidase [Spirosomaceae bacterium]|nr:M15 family metallopeptidase [Spirosomataceae bacterium]